MTTTTSITTESTSTESTSTEKVVRSHLQAFLEQQGVAAIVSEYDESARFYTEDAIYHGRQEIAGFFADFISALPADALGRFTVRSLQVEGNVAYITWSVGAEIPLGTDTFVVTDGRIVAQTFAMQVVRAP